MMVPTLYSSGCVLVSEGVNSRAFPMEHSDRTMSIKDPFENHINSSLLLLNYKSEDFDLGEMVYKCHNLSGSLVWLGIKVASLALGLPFNIAFFWLLMLSKSALSTYEVLCFNLALTNTVHCLCLPIDIYSIFQRPTEESLSAAEAISIFNLFSCPVLLASMCLERLIAVARRETSQLLSKSKYRMWYSGLMWLLTAIVAFVVYFHGILSSVLGLGVVIAIMIALGLLSLLGLVCTMCTRGGEQVEGDEAPEPKAALMNVLVLLLPFAAFYVPFLALDHFLIRLHAKRQLANVIHCQTLQVFIAIPNFGLFIGPVTYLPGAVKRVCCAKKVSDPAD